MTLPLYDAAVLALASGRIAYSITQDVLFKPVRDWLIVRDAVAEREGVTLSELFNCAWCMSFWTSAAALIAYATYPIETVALLSLFALWALSNLIAKALS